jgi:hypothetical protein
MNQRALYQNPMSHFHGVDDLCLVGLLPVACIQRERLDAIQLVLSSSGGTSMV